MCNILDKYPEETYTGYKVAYKKDGKYYSITSHVEYKPGPVQGVNKPIIALMGVSDSTDPENWFFLRSYFGRTSVFREGFDFSEHFKSVKTSNPGYNIVWLKMTLSGDLRYGSINKCTEENWASFLKECVSGTNIDSIEEWKQ